MYEAKTNELQNLILKAVENLCSEKPFGLKQKKKFSNSSNFIGKFYLFIKLTHIIMYPSDWNGDC